jgi:hypothetical protein
MSSENEHLQRVTLNAQGWAMCGRASRKLPRRPHREGGSVVSEDDQKQEDGSETEISEDDAIDEEGDAAMAQMMADVKRREALEKENLAAGKSGKRRRTPRQFLTSGG